MTYYVQLPPDSTGKKVRHRQIVDAYITSEVTRPKLDSIVVGSISGATGTLSGISTDNADPEYHITRITGTFVSGDILSVGGVVAGTISILVDSATQSINVVDPENPNYRLAIDGRGAANVRFTEGEPQTDAFGRLQVSQMQAAGEYYHINDELASKYWSLAQGGGSITYIPQESMVRYSCGTASGDLAQRTTNQYHPYKPGTSQLIYWSISCGDAGKANVLREWGYYDDFNGFGFRLNGTTLQAFLRSDVTGTVVERVVSKANWSEINNLDFPLDVSKANLYWADMEWLGVGRVRMGVVDPTGRRITTHIFENANESSLVYMRSGNLPLRWRQENVGISASTSEMKVSCAVVLTESADIKYSGRAFHHSPAAPIPVTNSAEYVPFLSFRPKLTYNGIPNRIIGMHEAFDFCAIGDPLHVAIFVNPTTMTGVSWSDTIVPGSLLQVDESSTAISQDGTLIESFLVGANQSIRFSLGDRIEKSFGLPADGVSQPTFVFAVKLLKTGGASSLFYTKYWKEVR